MADDFKYHIDQHGSLVRPAALLSLPEQNEKLRLVETVARYYWGNEI
jgi:hypothetical protein